MPFQRSREDSRPRLRVNTQHKAVSNARAHHNIYISCAVPHGRGCGPASHAWSFLRRLSGGSNLIGGCARRAYLSVCDLRQRIRQLWAEELRQVILNLSRRPSFSERLTNTCSVYIQPIAAHRHHRVTFFAFWQDLQEMLPKLTGFRIGATGAQFPFLASSLSVKAMKVAISRDGRDRAASDYRL